MARSPKYFAERANRKPGFEPHPRQRVRVNPGFDKPEDTPLDRINSALAVAGKRLHPTKGFRKLNVRNDRAAEIVRRIKSGVKGFDMLTIRQYLLEGYDARTIR